MSHFHIRFRIEHIRQSGQPCDDIFQLCLSISLPDVKNMGAAGHGAQVEKFRSCSGGKFIHVLSRGRIGNMVLQLDDDCAEIFLPAARSAAVRSSASPPAFAVQPMATQRQSKKTKTRCGHLLFTAGIDIGESPLRIAIIAFFSRQHVMSAFS